MARAARASRRDPDAESSGGLEPAAFDAVRLLATAPATTTRSWVSAQLDALGVGRYVELVEVVSTTTGMETLIGLLDCPAPAFPDPQPGSPRRDPVDQACRKGKAWVPMNGFQVPPNVLSAVPASRKSTNDLLDFLYMTDEQMDEPDISFLDLHRSQIEIVAVAASLTNECFY